MSSFILQRRRKSSCKLCLWWYTLEYKGALEKLFDMFCENNFKSLECIVFPLNIGGSHWAMMKIDLVSKVVESVDFNEGFRNNAKTRSV